MHMRIILVYHVYFKHSLSTNILFMFVLNLFESDIYGGGHRDGATTLSIMTHSITIKNASLV